MNKSLFIFCGLFFTLVLTGCAGNEKNIGMSVIEERIVSEIKIENPKITDLKSDNSSAERYGVPLSKIEEGFVYTNDDSGKSADEIIVIKVKDKKNISDVERALEAEITGLSEAWEGVDKAEYEKVQKHILRSRGKYVMLAICDESKQVEEVFSSLLS